MSEIKIVIGENGEKHVESPELTLEQVRKEMENALEGIKMAQFKKDIETNVVPKLLDAIQEELHGEDLPQEYRPRVLEPVQGMNAITYDEYLALNKLAASIEPNVVITPTYMTEKAVGADCFASEEVTIEPGGFAIVPIGFKAAFDGDNEGLFPFIRSSIPDKKGIILANGVGVIESDYHGNPDNDGNIGFKFWNISASTVTISRFERVGQLVLMPILRFDNAGRAGMVRGASGSTGS